MLLMIAYAASIGGIGTKVGSPPNLITLGQLELTDCMPIERFDRLATGIARREQLALRRVPHARDTVGARREDEAAVVAERDRRTAPEPVLPRVRLRLRR